MLDSFIRAPFESFLESAGQKFQQAGLNASRLTVIALILGLVACFAIGMAQYLLSLALILLTRLLSATASVMASKTGDTFRHTMIAGLADFTFFGAFVFFFTLGATGHGLAATLVVFSFLSMGMAHLVYTSLSAQKETAIRGTAGLVENSEMLIFMVAACLYPQGFSFFALFFALMCFVTAILRTAKALRL